MKPCCISRLSAWRSSPDFMYSSESASSTLSESRSSSRWVPSHLEYRNGRCERNLSNSADISHSILTLTPVACVSRDLIFVEALVDVQPFKDELNGRRDRGRTAMRIEFADSRLQAANT